MASRKDYARSGAFEPPVAFLTVIEEGATLVGDIVSEENIRVRGRVEGNVSTSGSVVIEPRAFVVGEITAANLILEGSLEGRVTVARKFELRPSGRMRGDIKAAIVAIAEDAFLQGKVLATERISTTPLPRRADRR
ncbi:MAG TPA: polymer-forming cytoskeletal protein [Patescibacteria group bacterium]|nr:polymer-forming cytoskeletal protein [Patescibacteria group bacterium]